MSDHIVIMFMCFWYYCI